MHRLRLHVAPHTGFLDIFEMHVQLIKAFIRPLKLGLLVEGMKVAVVHDRLTEFGGAARVVLVLARSLKASLYTAKYRPDRTFSEFNDLNVREINPIPDLSTPWGHVVTRMLDAIKFASLNELKDYDLIFTSGEWAHFASSQNPNSIWYCHTPNRVLYDLRKKIRNRLNPLPRYIFDLWTRFWTRRDQFSVKHIYKIVANSLNVRRRIKKFYKRDAETIYPPVDVDRFYFKPAENYWLSVQRLEPEKRVEIQLKIFEKLPKEKLIIVGKIRPTDYGRRIRYWIERLPNVEWQKEVSDEELKELYARCKAVIQTPVDEDFGLVAIEAMASGKPCLAVDEGGFRETIIHGKTGLLIKKPYVRNFLNAIKNFEKYDFDQKRCLKRAREFSEGEFVNKIRKIATEILFQEHTQ